MAMDVRDNEYYEARAKDVKLGDITSDEHNAGILAMLRDNDPEFTSISIGCRTPEVEQEASAFDCHLQGSK